LRVPKDAMSPIKVSGGAQRKRWGDNLS